MIELFDTVENLNEFTVTANNNVAPEIEFSWDED